MVNCVVCNKKSAHTASFKVGQGSMKINLCDSHFYLWSHGDTQWRNIIKLSVLKWIVVEVHF